MSGAPLGDHADDGAALVRPPYSQDYVRATIAVGARPEGEVAERYQLPECPRQDAEI